MKNVLIKKLQGGVIMKIVRNSSISSVIFFIVLTAILVSCGGGGGGDNTPACTSCSNVAGIWSTSPNHETVHPGTCGGNSYTEGATYTAVQNGCSLTVTTSGKSFSGQICNNTISWTGSYPDGTGTTTITSSSFTLSGNTFAGTAYWTWSGSTSCSGSTDVTATKQ
jgi:hypothetical protein